MQRVFTKEGHLKFESHNGKVDEDVEKYEESLPEGMVPVREYTESLLAAPTSLVVKVSTSQIVFSARVVTSSLVVEFYYVCRRWGPTVEKKKFGVQA